MPCCKENDIKLCLPTKNKIMDLISVITNDDEWKLEEYHWNGYIFTQDMFDYALRLGSHKCLHYMVVAKSKVFQKRNNDLVKPAFVIRSYHLKTANHKGDAKCVEILLKDQNLRDECIYDDLFWMSFIRGAANDSVFEQLCKSRFDLSICEEILWKNLPF